MNPHSETIKYYNEHAEDYIRNTLNVDMESVYRPFLKTISREGHILDVGCGSGRDSKAFLEMGFRVTPIDAATKMVEATRALTGVNALELSFKELSFIEQFDGVWACASLLHLPKSELDESLHKIIISLKKDGVAYFSFKEGEGEFTVGGRYFSYFLEEELLQILGNHSDLRLLDLWKSKSRIQENETVWINILTAKNTV